MKDKNILPFAGKPLLAWTIEAGLRSRNVAEIVVSTEDPEIAGLAKHWGAEMPVLRPVELASDEATSFSVVGHMIEFYRKELKRSYEYAVLLQPSSPLRTAEDIDGAIEVLKSKNADAVVSVCETSEHPYLSGIIPPDGSMGSFLRPEAKNRREQDFPTYYRANGAIYVCRIERLLAEKTFYLSSNIFSYVMDRHTSVDIDTTFDFDFAEFLAQRRAVGVEK